MHLLRAGTWLDRRATVTGCRRVLAVAHTLTSTTQLLRVMHLFASDLRVQVLFTIAPDDFGDGVDRFLGGLGVRVVPWQAAVEDHHVDLAVAASLGELHKLRVPVVTLAHGAGRNKLVHAPAGGGPRAGREIYGFDRSRLVRDGRVIPARIALSHTGQRELLAQSCPEACRAGVVVGDPCHDQIQAALPDRRAYRRALGVGDGQKLVVVSSTWGPRSLFNRCRDLLPALLRELPLDTYQVVAVLHPNIQTGHSRFQRNLWLADLQQQGLRVVEPTDDWQVALVGADWVIGDHGSVTLYATLTEAPVLLATFPDAEVAPGSPPALLAEAAPRLCLDAPIEPQLDAAAARQPAGLAVAARGITSAPGRFAASTRRVLYELLCMEEPATDPWLPALQVPAFTRSRSLPA
jgi:hypothetical protein